MKLLATKIHKRGKFCLLWDKKSKKSEENKGQARVQEQIELNFHKRFCIIMKKRRINWMRKEQK